MKHADRLGMSKCAMFLSDAGRDDLAQIIAVASERFDELVEANAELVAALHAAKALSNGTDASAIEAAVTRAVDNVLGPKFWFASDKYYVVQAVVTEVLDVLTHAPSPAAETLSGFSPRPKNAVSDDSATAKATPIDPVSPGDVA
jgi:hypothetical protein